jgi:hypothetical protein
MKTAFFNGLNAGKLDLNYNIRYRPSVNVSAKGMERQMQYLFNQVNFEHLYYVWENDEDSKHKHSHTLIKANDDDFIKKLQENIKSNKKVKTGTREVEYQKVRTLTNPKNGEKDIRPVIVRENVEYVEIKGRHGVVFIEPILSKVASSIYANKFTEYKETFGYLVPALMYQNPQ